MISLLDYHSHTDKTKQHCCQRLALPGRLQAARLYPDREHRPRLRHHRWLDGHRLWNRHWNWHWHWYRHRHWLWNRCHWRWYRPLYSRGRRLQHAQGQRLPRPGFYRRCSPALVRSRRDGSIEVGWGGGLGFYGRPAWLGYGGVGCFHYFSSYSTIKDDDHSSSTLLRWYGVAGVIQVHILLKFTTSQNP